MPLQSVNDFVVRFANVNGSGSASANELFARSVLRMGIPVAPRNIFPSNIQGLPTWYEVRICEAGHLGARGGTDLMVAMNPQTWDKDVAGIEPGGYLLYDSTKPMPASKFRSDITVIGVPLTAITNREYTDPRQRQLFKNIIYVGALSALLDMDVPTIEQLISEQFKGKEKLFDANKHALHLGRDWALLNLDCPIGIKLKRANAVGDRIFIEGNSAAALGAVYGGATVCAWYPITPSSSLAEAFTRHCQRLRVDPETKKNKFAIVQAEDELASIGIVIGAGWNGARSFTATSGPGISLMQEFLGLAYFAEIPAVVFDVQRAGPSTGMPTRTQQTDIMSCAYASHGDTKHVLLLPENPAETFEFGAEAFDLADRLQTPIFVMMDLEIGMNHHLCRPLTWDDKKVYDRGKVMTAEELEAGKDFGRYLDVDGDGIPYRTFRARIRARARSSPAAPRATATRATPRKARPTPTTCSGCCASSRPRRTWCRARCRPTPSKPTKYGVIYYGSTSPAMDEAIRMLEANGQHLDRLRVRAFPFHSSVSSFIADHDFVFVVEQNRDAQLRSLIVNECSIDPVRLVPILHYDGTPITARFIARAIGDHLDALKVTPLRKVGVMTYVVKPKFHHPELPKNKLGFTHRDYEGSISTLCAGCGHEFDLGLDHRGLLRTLDRAAPGGEAFRHRLLVEDADLFPRQFARLQLRARAHAVGADRRQSRQPRPDLSRRVRRRRLRLDRLRPVRARDAPRRQHGLHRREQRRVWPDQGPVLRHRRPRLEIEARRHQQRQRHRHGRHGFAARRQLRRALVLRRQEAAHPAHQGGDRARGRGLHRRDLALRRLQQSRRLDQELRLRARAQRGGELPRFHDRPRADPGRLRAGHGRDGRAARRHHARAAQGRCRIRRP